MVASGSIKLANMRIVLAKLALVDLWPLRGRALCHLLYGSWDLDEMSEGAEHDPYLR